MLSWTVLPLGSLEDLEEADYFGIRYWNGIDKPEYKRLFEITFKERDLESGRFENFVYNNFSERSTFRSVQISSKDLVIMFYWMFDNMTSKWSCELDFYGDPTIMDFWFEEDVDAMVFKLMWR